MVKSKSASSSSSTATSLNAAAGPNANGSAGSCGPRKTSPALQEAKRRARNMLKSQSNGLGSQLEPIIDIFQNAVNAKSMHRGATALIYDESMSEHCCLWDSTHQERPERFTRTMERCRELNLVDRCLQLKSRLATKDEILKLHSIEHYERLEQTSGVRNEEAMEELSSHYDAIYIHPSTFKLSLLASGSTIELIDQLLLGKAQNGMAIIRPPGHHAMKSEFNGYCYFNNVALAAQHALEAHQLQRILIIDYDVHHGQGTQRFFYNDSRVLYFSIHRYEHGSFWPNLQESDYHAIGSGPGTGYNFNVPLNTKGMGNGDYLAIFQQLLLPVAMEYQPELIIVSAGYDAALGCPEGEMEVTPACYPHLLNPLLHLANCRVAVVLEGGYCVESLSEGAALTLRALLGDPCPPLVERLELPSMELRESVLNCIYVHRPYWRCLQLQQTYTPADLESESAATAQLHRVKRIWLGGPPPEPDQRYPTRGTSAQLPEDVVARNAARLSVLRAETQLSVPAIRVCYAYDAQMLQHFNLHDATHPEQPMRIRQIHQMHDDYQLLGRMHQLSARAATTDEVCLAHTRAHVNSVRRLLGRSVEELQQMGAGYNSVYLHPRTFECATLASGSVLQAVDSVLRGQSRSGICNVRPPGHHAEPDQPHGFCIFNNIAIAAQYAIREFGLERILIVDWDVHHGNGTQHIFESNPKVLYMSIHRYEHGAFFPKGPAGNYDMVGKNAGRGFNVNIPWNKKGMGDLEYALAFQQLILPIAYEFNPQLVLVSAGFDAAIGDPLGGCKVTPEGYGLFTHWLSALAGGRIIVCLEGGYNVNSISYAMTMCTKTLLGDPVPTPQFIPAAQRSATVAFQSCVETLQLCVEQQHQYWKSLVFGCKLPQCVLGENNNEDFLAATMSQLSISNDNALGAVGGDASQQPDPGQDRPSGSKPKVKVKTLTEFMAEHKEALEQQEMFAIYPLKSCPHLSQLRSEQAPKSINTSGACGDCGSMVENWMCLSCQSIGCGRYINEHMEQHCRRAQHPLVLSFSDLSVWCYECNNYIDHPLLYVYQNLAHVDKFKEPMPWTHGCQQRTDGCYPIQLDAADSNKQNNNNNNNNNHGASGCSSNANTNNDDDNGSGSGSGSDGVSYYIQLERNN
ncbi:histone deacetylase 6 isoform X1 [Drosophila mojavensis]|nr:histone deacetylase 6 isoform X1 [Drosophila mojavensis]